MRHLLIPLLLLLSISTMAQTVQPRAVRLYRLNDQVVMTDSLGNTPASYPASLVTVRALGNYVEVVVGSASVYFRPAQLLNSTGTIYGSTVKNAITTFLTTAPTINAAGFGSVTDVNTAITNSTQTVTSTGKIYLLLTNVGSSAATLLVGAASYPLAAGSTWEYVAIQDRRTGLYTPIPAVTVTATSTIININQKSAQ